MISRQMAEVVRRDKLLPQPFLIVNKTGGSGVIGFSYFKTKRGDPHCLMSVTSTLRALTALRKAHESPEWKDFARRNMDQDIFLGSAEFSKFLVARMVEYKAFCDAVGLARKN